MSLRDRIKEILSENGISLRETSRSFHAKCPECGKPDKLYIDKKTGATVCFRDSWHFKGSFPYYLAKTLGISIEEARQMVLSDGNPVDVNAPLIIDLLGSNKVDEEQEYLQPIHWPEIGTESAISNQEAFAYAQGRGIDTVMMAKYDMQFDPYSRRLQIPIKMQGICYGWQGRAIDPVEPKHKVRNNVGFNRGKLVMFTDNLINSEHCIVSEGPFDALKFELCGGNVATMGNVVTPEQLETIFSFPFKRFYVALDEDSPAEIRKLALASQVEAYIITVPQSAKDRCKALNKKADFGECTFEECLQAFKDAKPFDSTTLLVYLKD
jgi:hypothetical protein